MPFQIPKDRPLTYEEKITLGARPFMPESSSGKWIGILGALGTVGWLIYMMWTSYLYMHYGELINPETENPEDRIMAYTSHDRNLCGNFKHDEKGGYQCMTASPIVHTIYICNGYISVNTNTTNATGCLLYKIPNYNVGAQFPSRKEFLTKSSKELFVTEISQ